MLVDYSTIILARGVFGFSHYSKVLSRGKPCSVVIEGWNWKVYLLFCEKKVLFDFVYQKKNGRIVWWIIFSLNTTGKLTFLRKAWSVLEQFFRGIRGQLTSKINLSETHWGKCAHHTRHVRGIEKGALCSGRNNEKFIQNTPPVHM